MTTYSVICPKLERNAVPNHCAKCRMLNVRSFCSACHIVKYCSLDCQRADWIKHRPRCVQTQKIRARDMPAMEPTIGNLTPFPIHQVKHALGENLDGHGQNLTLNSKLVCIEYLIHGTQVPTGNIAEMLLLLGLGCSLFPDIIAGFGEEARQREIFLPLHPQTGKEYARLQVYTLAEVRENLAIPAKVKEMIEKIFALDVDHTWVHLLMPNPIDLVVIGGTVNMAQIHAETEQAHLSTAQI